MRTIEELARALGNGRENKVADGWVTTCPAHNDGKASLSLRAPHGKILFKCHAGCTQEAVRDALIAQGLWEKRQAQETWKPIRPIPDGISAPKEIKHSKHGKPARVWEYKEADGRLIGLICRFEDGKGNKTLIPLSYCYSDKGNKRWTWKSFDKPRPLYNLPLFKNKEKPVIIFEGEKAADAGQKYFGEQYICTAWPGGAAAVKYADISPLKGRHVVLWPDNDEPGLKAMSEIADIILQDHQTAPYIVNVPGGLPEGWDIADELPDGFDVDYHILVNKASKYEPVSDVEIARLNKDYALIITGGRPAILYEQRDLKDGSIDQEFWSTDAFRLYFSNQIIQSGRSQVKLGDYWINHPERRTYRGLVFEPGIEREGYYNLWQGFSFEPDGSGQWDIFHEHLLNNVCQGDQELFTWVFGWFAHMMQKPQDKSGTSLSLRGQQGSGKTIVGKIFGRLIKKHYTLIDQERYLFDRFNSHMASTILLHSDEGFWGGDPRHIGKLKSIVTSDTQRIENKRVDSIEIRNYVRLLITTNDDWVVPTAFDERRFAVLDVGNNNQQDIEYFVEMLKQMENGGYEALLYDLLNFDLSQTNVRVIPHTAALDSQKEMSMQPIDSYWYTCLIHGNTLLSNPSGWLGTVKTAELHDDCITFLHKMGHRRPPHLNVFFKRLRLLCPPESLQRKLIGPDRQSAITLPTLDEARMHFDKITRLRHDWLSLEMSDEQQAPQIYDQGDEIPF